jgi:hypothetical protein
VTPAPWPRSWKAFNEKSVGQGERLMGLVPVRTTT